MNEALISTKGQGVVPHEFRERYHLRPRSKAVWVDLGGVLLLSLHLSDPVRQLRGLLRDSKLTQKSSFASDPLSLIPPPSSASQKFMARRSSVRIYCARRLLDILDEPAKLREKL